MARYRLLAAYGAAALWLEPSSALAQSSCGAATSLDQDLDIVAPCELDGAEVNGNVTIFAGGSLTARDVLIRGDLDASRAFVVDLERSRIDGNVELEELVGDASSIELTTIGGDLVLAGNRSLLTILNNDVAGATQAIGNTGGLTISGNTFAAGLDCSGNTPAPVGIANLLGDDDDKNDKKDKDDKDEDRDDDEDEDDAGDGGGVERDDDAGDADNEADDSGEDAGDEQDRDDQCEDIPAPPPAAAPPSSPPESSPPPASTPPATTTTPTATPPAATEEDDLADEGGVGALDWAAVLLLSLLAWRRLAGRRT